MLAPPTLPFRYSGVNLKIQRYSNMIAALKNLQSYWIALDG